MACCFCYFSLLFFFPGANYFSNVANHPTQKLDYGIINKWRGKHYENLWWGTRTEHLFTIPATLTAADHGLQYFWNKVFLPAYRVTEPMSWQASPKTFLVHLWAFAVLGIFAYNAQDAYFNPAHEGKRMETFKKGMFPTVVGAGLQWQVPMVDDFVKGILRAPKGVVGYAAGVVAPISAFCAVKAGGFHDYGEVGLTPTERRLNGLEKMVEKKAEKKVEKKK